MSNIIQVPVKIKFLDPEAKACGLPKYRYSGDAGADLHVILPEKDRLKGLEIGAYSKHMLPTGMAMQISTGYWARIVHRSSTESKLGLRVIEGTIDQGFQGPLFVHILNYNSMPIRVFHKDRIAQLVISPIVQGIFEENDQFEPTDRQTAGFGSTGYR